MIPLFFRTTFLLYPPLSVYGKILNPLSGKNKNLPSPFHKVCVCVRGGGREDSNYVSFGRMTLDVIYLGWLNPCTAWYYSITNISSLYNNYSRKSYVTMIFHQFPIISSLNNSYGLKQIYFGHKYDQFL